MITRYDEDAKMAMSFAENEARELGRDCIGTEHILLALTVKSSFESAAVMAMD